MSVETRLAILSQEVDSQRETLSQLVKGLGTLNRRIIELQQEVATLKAAHEAALQIAPEQECRCCD